MRTWGWGVPEILSYKYRKNSNYNCFLLQRLQFLSKAQIACRKDAEEEQKEGLQDLTPVSIKLLSE